MLNLSRISLNSFSTRFATKARSITRQGVISGPSSVSKTPSTCFIGGGGGGGGGGRGRGGSKRTFASGDNSMGGSSDNGGGLWGKYLQLLETQPFMTRVLTCGVLNGLGDIFCQLFVEKDGYNAKRTLTFAGLGVVFVGPCLFYWYGLLGKLVPGTDLMSILASLALDQLVYAPIFIAGFMSILTAIEGKPEAIQAKLQQDLFPAIKVNWGLWVPAQYINFKYVPPNLRTLAVNITALIWNVYMSWSSHKAVAAAPPPPTPTLTPPSKAAKKGGR